MENENKIFVELENVINNCNNVNNKHKDFIIKHKDNPIIKQYQKRIYDIALKLEELIIN